MIENILYNVWYVRTVFGSIILSVVVFTYEVLIKQGQCEGFCSLLDAVTIALWGSYGFMTVAVGIEKGILLGALRKRKIFYSMIYLGIFIGLIITGRTLGENIVFLLTVTAFISTVMLKPDIDELREQLNSKG